MASKIRKNDEIIVISGKDKGKRGIVKHVFSTGKIIVEGINIIKKHQKPIPNLNKPGGIIEKEASIATSNVAIFNKETGKADGVKFKFENGKKIRMFKSTNLIIK